VTRNWKSNKSAIPLVVTHKGGATETINLTDED